jgi:hypothetical protein
MPRSRIQTRLRIDQRCRWLGWTVSALSSMQTSPVLSSRVRVSDPSPVTRHITIVESRLNDAMHA